MADDFMKIVIYGGNYGQFWTYGYQKGDGKAVIRKENQCRQTAGVMVLFI